jgi:hypothetical protein
VPVICFRICLFFDCLYGFAYGCAYCFACCCSFSVLTSLTYGCAYGNNFAYAHGYAYGLTYWMCLLHVCPLTAYMFLSFTFAYGCAYCLPMAVPFALPIAVSVCAYVFALWLCIWLHLLYVFEFACPLTDYMALLAYYCANCFAYCSVFFFASVFAYVFDL